MKILYLSTWDFSNEESDGVCKKIYSQIKVFEDKGYDVDYTYIKNNLIYFNEHKKEKIVGHVGEIKKTPTYIKLYKVLKNSKYDYVYNRYGMMDTFYFHLLKRLHLNGARIVIEIPTYPYEGEKKKGILNSFMFAWDRFYLKYLSKVCDRIITYSRDTQIFGIQTIQIINGIEIDKITPVSGEAENDEIIDLIAVALMQPYHGYERIILGIKEYYRKNGKRKVIFHLVGDGSEKEYYEKIVEENHLEDKVIFYGRKNDKELEKLYNKADIGICSLGCYKKGMYWSSELKAREYLAKGIPIVLGMNSDICDYIDEDFYLNFPNNDSVIDIDKIIAFYDNIYKKGHKEVIKKIRAMAEPYINMNAAMKPVCDYFRYYHIEEKR